MTEITILSGKGGTGKTSVTAALASLAKNAVLCDNDVDAADLHLLLHPVIEKTTLFKGAWVAAIDPERCTGCGICASYCRYVAISGSGNTYLINPFLCEGCRLCERVCPENSITSEQSEKNNWYLSTTRFGKMVHAQMGPGEENSGKLVSLIRQKAKVIAEEQHAAYILNDGPPGIGCPVIASVTGTGHVLLVIEPTLSGLHDAQRLVELVNGFHIGISAIVNKWDLNPAISEKVEDYLKIMKIPILARIPFDPSFVEAMIVGKTVVEYAPGSALTNTFYSIWEQLESLLSGE